jgi:hypothetical protein
MVVVDFAANCSSAKNTWICSQRPEKHAPATTGARGCWTSGDADDYYGGDMLLALTASRGLLNARGELRWAVGSSLGSSSTVRRPRSAVPGLRT